jgi:hypothetical protein
MSTKHDIDTDDGPISVTTYYGGTDRGPMFQINDPDGKYIQISAKQFIALIGFGIRYIGDGFRDIMRAVTGDR